MWGSKIKGYPKFKWKEKSIKKESEAHNIAKGRVGNIHCLVQKKIIGSKKSIQVFDGNIFMIKILIKTFSAKDKLYNVQTRLC